MTRCKLMLILVLASAHAVRAEPIERDWFSESDTVWFQASAQWKSAVEIRGLFERALSDEAVRQTAFAKLTDFAAQEAGKIARLEDGLKGRIIQTVIEYERFHPASREEAMRMLGLFGPVRRAAVPLIIEGLKHHDPEARKAAERLVPFPVEKVASDPAMLAEIGQLMLDKKFEVADAAEKLIKDDGSKDVQRLYASMAVAAVAQRRGRATELLKRHGVPTSVFSRAIADELIRLNLAGQAEPAGQIVLAVERMTAMPELLGMVELDLPLAAASAIARQGPSGLETILTRGMAAAKESLPQSVRAATERDVIFRIRGGETVTPRKLTLLNLDGEEFGRTMLGALKEPRSRVAAAKALAIVGVKGEPVRAILTKYLRDPDAELRHAAADALNTPEARELASVPDLLRELRDDEPNTRQGAARRFQSLSYDAKEVGLALMSAVDKRDLAAREGLLLGIEKAFYNSSTTLEALNGMASDEKDATRRAYARAALREMQAVLKASD